MPPRRSLASSASQMASMRTPAHPAQPRGQLAGVRKRPVQLDSCCSRKDFDAHRSRLARGQPRGHETTGRVAPRRLERHAFELGLPAPGMCAPARQLARLHTIGQRPLFGLLPRCPIRRYPLQAVLHSLSIHLRLAPVVELPVARLSASRFDLKMDSWNAYTPQAEFAEPECSGMLQAILRVSPRPPEFKNEISGLAATASSPFFVGSRLCSSCVNAPAKQGP